jgi:hypothetical protein
MEPSFLKIPRRAQHLFAVPALLACEVYSVNGHDATTRGTLYHTSGVGLR